MEHFGTAQFPSLTTSVSDLYGASSYRMCEAQEYELGLDELDREELALEQMVQSLVERKAPLPIGVKFHRPSDHDSRSAGMQHSDSIRGIHRGTGRGGEGAEGEEEDDDEDDEDDDEDEEDDMDEDEMDEDEDDDDAFAAEEQELDDVLDSGEDPFAREDYSLDDVSMEMAPPPDSW